MLDWGRETTVKHHTLALAGLLTLGVPVAAQADVLVLQNGSRERGVLVKETEEGYWFRSGPGMKLLYGRDEVTELQRESADTNAAIRASWKQARETAEPSTPQQSAAPAEANAPAAAAKPADLPQPADGEVLPKGQRYDYINGGGFQAGIATPRDVTDKLGNPDKVQKHDDGTETWIYDCGGKDGYCMTFGKIEGKTVLTNARFASNWRQQEERAAQREAWEQIPGH